MGGRQVDVDIIDNAALNALNCAKKPKEGIRPFERITMLRSYNRTKQFKKMGRVLEVSVPKPHQNFGHLMPQAFCIRSDTHYTTLAATAESDSIALLTLQRCVTR